MVLSAVLKFLHSWPVTGRPRVIFLCIFTLEYRSGPWRLTEVGAVGTDHYQLKYTTDNGKVEFLVNYSQMYPESNTEEHWTERSPVILTTISILASLVRLSPRVFGTMCERTEGPLEQMHKGEMKNGWHTEVRYVGLCSGAWWTGAYLQQGILHLLHLAGKNWDGHLVIRLANFAPE